jgi:hypothetical protein
MDISVSDSSLMGIQYETVSFAHVRWVVPAADDGSRVLFVFVVWEANK